jgi:hypothetical protein
VTVEFIEKWALTVCLFVCLFVCVYYFSVGGMTLCFVFTIKW